MEQTRMQTPRAERWGSSSFVVNYSLMNLTHNHTARLQELLWLTFNALVEEGQGIKWNLNDLPGADKEYGR